VFYALGSGNPVKEDATRSVLERYHDDLDLEPVSVDPGIGAMPMSWETARTGARNRAFRAAHQLDADRGVGIEGYIEHAAFLTVWTVIMENANVIGEGGSGRIRLPDEVTSRLPDEELGMVINDTMERDDVPESEGTVGVMTDGRLTREEFTRRSIVHAMEQVLGNEA
jgi:inosine/xanthosine triphosphatase